MRFGGPARFRVLADAFLKEVRLALHQTLRVNGFVPTDLQGDEFHPRKGVAGLPPLLVPERDLEGRTWGVAGEGMRYQQAVGHKLDVPAHGGVVHADQGDRQRLADELVLDLTHAQSQRGGGNKRTWTASATMRSTRSWLRCWRRYLRYLRGMAGSGSLGAYSRHAKSQCSPSSREISSFEKLKPEQWG